MYLKTIDWQKGKLFRGWSLNYFIYMHLGENKKIQPNLKKNLHCTYTLFHPFFFYIYQNFGRWAGYKMTCPCSGGLPREVKTQRKKKKKNVKTAFGKSSWNGLDLERIFCFMVLNRITDQKKYSLIHFCHYEQKFTTMFWVCIYS